MLMFIPFSGLDEAETQPGGLLLQAADKKIEPLWLYDSVIKNLFLAGQPSVPGWVVLGVDGIENLMLAEF